MTRMLIIGVAIAVASATATAQAAETTQYTLSGLTATTSFSTTVGCVETRALTTAVDGTVRSATSGSTNTSTLFAYVAQIDWCTGDYLVSAFGVATLAPEAFTIDRKLTAATLNVAGVVVFDFVSGTERTVDANVRWTGVGDTFDQRSRTHTRSEGFTMTTRTDETFREAAASGSVRSGGTEFAPQPGYSPSLSSVRSGSVTVTQ